MAQTDLSLSVPEGLKNSIPLTAADADILDNIKRLCLPDGYRNKTLPDSVDNSQYIWFRPIFSQEIYPNCMQSTSIAYNFTYEINRLRNLPADEASNQYSPNFAWNFFNGGNGWYGVNYLFTVDVIKNHGIPSVADYGGFYYGGGQRWMSGYNEWYNAMGNRINDIYSIYVGDEEGLLTLKHWLNDHLDGSETGGVASFIACSPYGYVVLPPESVHSGQYAMKAWCDEPAHGMTIVGYNDFIKYDYNGDGMFTNDIDINNDGLVDMKDREIGALKFANSYGDNFANNGYCYMMYKTLADDISEGGIWRNTVHVLDAKKAHTTLMTYKVSLEHNFRELLRVRVGISADTSSKYPEHTHGYTIFNYQGGKHYMQGNDTTPDHKTIEFGLDVSPLLSLVEPGLPCKFFLIIDERDEENLGTGQVNYFSLMDYSNGVLEVPCSGQNIPLLENGTTFLSAVHTPDFSKVNIATDLLPVYEPGQELELQMQAQGGQPPYTWSLDKNYFMNVSNGGFPGTDEELLIGNSATDSLAVKRLDFSFPFYGNTYDSVILSASGSLYFDEDMYFWPYLVDMPYFMRNKRVIAPFLNNQMSIFQDFENGLWYEGDASHATFRWKTTLRSNPGSSEANFALSLYPDGGIDLYYNDIDLGEMINWAAGISEGDNMNYSLAELPFPDEIIPGTKVEFKARQLPSALSITGQGMLSIKQDEGGQIRDVGIMVRDNTLVSTVRHYQFTDGPEILLEIDGENSMIINGETSGFNLAFTNRGAETVNNIDLELHCDHPLISMLDDQEQISTVLPGHTVTVPMAFSCSSDVGLLDSQSIVFDLSANVGTKNYEKEFIVQSSAPLLYLFDFKILNQNGLLEPGTSADLEIRLVNQGGRISEQTRAQLFCNDPGIAIENKVLDFGDIAPGGISTVSVNLKADFGIYFGHEVDFNLLITDSNGLTHEAGFNFRVGRVPVCVIDLDPQRHSGPNIHEMLRQMDVESLYTTNFPVNLLNYQSVVICLGIQFSYHELSMKENLKMLNYLNNGGNIYMESRVHWNLEDNYAIFDRFNIDTEAYPGLYETLDGVDSTFTEGLAYMNIAAQPFSYFRLKPVAPAYSIFTGRTYPYCAAVAFDAGSYKTIGTLFELGSLISSDSCLVDSYMQEVLDFFGIVKSSLEIDENNIIMQGTAIYNYPNPFRDHTIIPIELSGRTRVEARVYDLQGRMVREIAPSEMLPAGRHNIVWDGRNLTGNAVPEGIYIVRVSIDERIVTGKLLLLR